MALSDVSNILWRERQLLELLVFKLEEEQLVLAAGRTRWLAHVTREVENVFGEIKRIELERAMAVAEAGRELVLPDSPTLRELATLCSSPWDGIFNEHRRAILTLAQEIDAITNSNRELLQRGYQAARAAGAAMGEIDIDAYDASARFQRVDALRSQNRGDALTMKKDLSNIEDADLAQVTMEVQLHQVTYQAALAPTAPAITPSLAQFLQ